MFDIVPQSVIVTRANGISATASMIPYGTLHRLHYMDRRYVIK